jgi:hypothetical protein
MKRQEVPLLGFAREGVDPGVAPDVAAVSAKAAKLDIVAMRSVPVLKTKTSSCWLRYSEPMPALSLTQLSIFFVGLALLVAIFGLGMR